MYVLRGTEAAINVLKFAPKFAREDGLLLSGYVKYVKLNTSFACLDSAAFLLKVKREK